MAWVCAGCGTSWQMGGKTWLGFAQLEEYGLVLRKFDNTDWVCAGCGISWQMGGRCSI